MLTFITLIFYFRSLFLSQLGYIIVYLFLIKLSYFLFCRFSSYFFIIDHISFWLIILLVCISCFIIISFVSFYNSFFFLLINFILIFSLIIVFTSNNLIIIYVFFEFSLVPLIIIIMYWGYQPERLGSRIYLFFYTLLASLPLLILIFYFYDNICSLNFCIFSCFSSNFILHLSIILTFLVKFPLFILHFWLPKAHVQAPVFGSIMLAGVILKVGGYGLIRLCIIHELSLYNYSYIWFCLSLIGSFYVSLICLFQFDIKILIAYSSVSHIGLCLCGFLGLRYWGFVGSYLIIISHGFCSSCIFYVANLFYNRTLRRRFFINKGIISYIPRLSWLWFILCSFNIGCPPRINFLREVIIFNRLIFYRINLSIFILLISFFCSCFRFFLFSYTSHGLPNYFYSFRLCSIKEYLVILVHLYPLFFIIFIIPRIF